MLDVTVKTLDGTNRSFSVPDDITVKQFKEKISGSINISADTQRLIFQGRVLQDDKKLTEYDVNGKTLHVVQRAPPSTSAPHTAGTGGASNTGGQDARGGFLGSFSVPGDGGEPTIQADGSSVDIHINLGQIGPAPVYSEAQNRIRIAHRMLGMARQALDKLENPPSSDSEDTGDSAPSGEASPDRQTPDPPATDAQTETPTGQGGATANTTAQGGATANGTAQPQNRTPEDPRVCSLADVLQEAGEVSARLQPYLTRYQTFLRDDPTLEDNSPEVRLSRRLAWRVSEVLHHLSHVYHAASDVMVDPRQAPPRTLRATPAPAFPTAATAVIQQTIPVQAQINVAHMSPRGSPRTPRRAPTATSTTSSSGTPSSAGTPAGTPASTPSTSSAPTSTAPTTGGATRTQPQIRLGGPFPPMFSVAPGTQIHMAGPPRMAGAAAFGPRGQPLMFMEVGPQGVAGQPPSAPTSQSGPVHGPPPPPGMAPTGQPNFLPPNFLQNIVQMAQQAALGAGGQGGQVIVGAMPTPQMASTTTQSSSTGTATTGTQATATSGQPPPRPPQGPPPRMAAFQLPGGAGGLLPGLPPAAHSVDPLLPCQSRFFLRRRLAAAAAATDGQQRNNNPQDLQGLISNIVSSAMSGMPGGQPMRTAQQTAGGPRQPAAPAQPAGGPPTHTTGPPAPGGPPPAIVQLQNLLQGAQATTPPSSSTSQASQTGPRSTAGGSPGGAGVGDETFAQMVRGIGTYVSQAATGQPTRDSIYDFINSLGQDGEASEGLLSDIFACISRHLTIVDLMSVLCQQTAPLQRLVAPLQEFVRERVLAGAEPTPDNLDAAATRLTEEMLPQIEDICTDAAVRDNLDFPASVQELLRHHLRTNAQLILDARENDPAFGTTLYNNIQRLIHEFLVLSGFCLEGRQQAVHRLVQANVQRISSDMNPLIQQWMSQMTVQSLQTTLRSTSVTEEGVQRYVVRRADSAPPVPPHDSPQSASSDASYMSAQSVDNGHATEEMEVEAPTPPEGRPQAVGLDPAVLARLPPPTHRPADPAVVIGTQDWHSQVPAEWVPIITADLDTQRQQPPQAPYSDAYLSSMPAKRRKLMTKSGSEPECVSVSSTLPGVIERAARSAGAEPVTSGAAVATDAATSTTLRTAYSAELRRHIRSRLRHDPDYNADRYPNTEKYYNSDQS